MTNATRSNLLHHNLEHVPGVQLMPRMYVDSDRVVDTKKRYDCLLRTHLGYPLRRLGVKTLLITGVDTHSCVLGTTITAGVRDYACSVVEDSVDTVDGPEFHDAALKCIRRAFGWTMPADDALREVGAVTAVAG